MQAREMLVLGRFPRKQRSSIEQAAEQAHLGLHHSESRDDANNWLDANEPAALLLDAGAPEQTALAIQARAQAAHARVPILALANEVGDLSFEEAFSFGADDVVLRGSVRPLTARLRALPAGNDSAAAEDRGTALVAVMDHNRRVLLGRVLRNAGYTVHFSVTVADLERLSEDSGLALAVVSDDLVPEAATVADKARNMAALWIYTCAPKRLAACRLPFEDLENANAADGFAPAENMLFLANEMRASGIKSRRGSPRILYGTTVAFRGAGLEEDDHGFSYNVSADGLFVRTMALPSDDTVWLELSPPRSMRRVRLVGEVAWRRRFGPSPLATVPPGFGVRIVDGARHDLAIWRDSYQQFCESML